MPDSPSRDSRSRDSQSRDGRSRDSRSAGEGDGQAGAAVARRRHWMAVLARASHPDMLAGLQRLGGLPNYTRLRGPEAGLVMVRGRAGGGGAPFNLGEMTVTRCSVRTDAGIVGHAYVAGRDELQAELAAVADAILQDPGRTDAVWAGLIVPLHAAQADQRRAVDAKAGATKVDFFAMRTMRT